MSGTARSAAIPRILISAGASGSGKTTITSGLLRCLSNKGIATIAYKCGPDYIDPMFHKTVLGIPCRNLDLFFSSEGEVRTLMAESSSGYGVAVVEGVMGFYDGLGGSSAQASAYHVARTTGTPVILVVDGRGVSLTLAATIKGLIDFREGSNIAAVIINRCSKALFEHLKPIIESECGIKALGYVENSPEMALESRHLGLVTAGEIDDLQARIDAMASRLEASIDFDALLEIASSAEPIDFEPSNVEPLATPEGAPCIAVAQDDAFCFYYEESLEHLRRLGARIVPFSPIADNKLPAEADALYIGGGYPELHAEELSNNLTMLESIRRVHRDGMPIFAECGGFMYLKERMADLDGREFEMVGILSGGAHYTGKLTRFGYVDLEAKADGLGITKGCRMRAHEFHYYDSDDNGSAMHASKKHSKRNWDCCIAEERLFAGFPHLYLPACDEFARGFVDAAIEFRAKRLG